ncbi:hypothetical protein D9599_28840 [Roseomonas sp. KE2513]|nr:hypothetical protein [Roseomonas sp. KE2513]
MMEREITSPVPPAGPGATMLREREGQGSCAAAGRAIAPAPVRSDAPRSARRPHPAEAFSAVWLVLLDTRS